MNKRMGLLLAGSFLVLFIGGGSRFAIGLTLKSMTEDFGSGRGAIGIAVGLFLVVSAAGMFVAGRLADRINARNVLLAGLVTSGIGIGLLGLAGAAWQVVALYGVVYAVGSGMASLTPIGVMITRFFPGRAGLANAVAISGMALGQLVIIAGLAVVLTGVGWRWVYLWIAVAHAVALPLVYATFSRRREAAATDTDKIAAAQPSGPSQPDAGPSNATPPEGVSVGQALRMPRFWLLLLIYAICGFDDFFVSTHIVALAQDKGLGAFLSGNLLALMGLTALAGVLAAGAWADRVGPVWPTLLAFGLRLVLCLAILADQSPSSIAVFALLFGATYLVTAPLTVLFVRDGFGTRHLGALSGFVTMVHHICGGIGAWIGAVLFDATGGYDRAFIVMAALTALALLGCLMLPRRRTGP